MKVRVEFLGKVEVVEVIIVNIFRPFVALFGRNWLDVFIPNWREAFSNETEVSIKTVSQDVSITNEIKSKFPRIVSTELDKPIEGFTADLVLKENFQPIIHCPYTLPYKLKKLTG